LIISPKEVEMAKNNVCMCGCGHGWGMLVLGLLVLGNAYWPTVSWPVFIGALAVLKGLWSMFVPCNCK